jgi:hypothetical protein
MIISVPSSVCGSELFFSDSDPALALILDPDSNPACSKKDIGLYHICPRSPEFRKNNTTIIEICKYLMLCGCHLREKNLTWTRIQIRNLIMDPDLDIQIISALDPQPWFLVQLDDIYEKTTMPRQPDRK